MAKCDWLLWMMNIIVRKSWGLIKWVDQVEYYKLKLKLKLKGGIEGGSRVVGYY